MKRFFDFNGVEQDIDIKAESNIHSITESSLKDLMEFHRIEREEKFKTLQFYGLFLGGGLALIAGTEKLGIDLFQRSFIQTVALIVIVMVIIMAIRKLIAVRIASNNIYVEYTSRMQYLIKLEVEKNLLAKAEDIKANFDKYYNIPTQKLQVMRKGSADALEIQILKWISMIFMFLSIIPIKVILIDTQFLIPTYLSLLHGYLLCFGISTVIVIIYRNHINSKIEIWSEDFKKSDS